VAELDRASQNPGCATSSRPVTTDRRPLRPRAPPDGPDAIRTDQARAGKHSPSDGTVHCPCQRIFQEPLRERPGLAREGSPRSPLCCWTSIDSDPSTSGPCQAFVQRPVSGQRHQSARPPRPIDSQPLRHSKRCCTQPVQPGQVCRLAVDHDTATGGPSRTCSIGRSLPPGPSGQGSSSAL
jgi:hypothetical protein